LACGAVSTVQSPRQCVAVCLDCLGYLDSSDVQKSQFPGFLTSRDDCGKWRLMHNSNPDSPICQWLALCSFFWMGWLVCQSLRISSPRPDGAHQAKLWHTWAGAYSPSSPCFLPPLSQAVAHPGGVLPPFLPPLPTPIEPNCGMPR